MVENEHFELNLKDLTAKMPKFPSKKLFRADNLGKRCTNHIAMFVVNWLVAPVLVLFGY